MPVYVYETVPPDGMPPRRFERKQSMREAALTHDPETGHPVVRIITGGLGPLTPRRGSGGMAAGGHAEGDCCPGCHS